MLHWRFRARESAESTPHGALCGRLLPAAAAAERAALLGLVVFDVSLTHSRTDAMAFVVGMKAEATSAVSGRVNGEGEFGSSKRS